MSTIKGFQFRPPTPPEAVPLGGTSTAEQARQAIKDYVGRLTDRKTGAVKSGVLYLRANADGTSQIMRDRAFHLRSRSGNAGTAQAAQAFRQLFTQAYADRMDPQQLAALERKLDNYLQARGQQVGTKSLVRFHAEFEQAASRHASLMAQARALQPSSAAGQSPVDPGTSPRAQLFRAAPAAPVGPGHAADATLASSSLMEAGDPKREQRRFVLPERQAVQVDPFDAFDQQRRASFMQDE